METSKIKKHNVSDLNPNDMVYKADDISDLAQVCLNKFMSLRKDYRREIYDLRATIKYLEDKIGS